MVSVFGILVLSCLQFYLTSCMVVFKNYDPKELEIGSTCSFNTNKTEGICRKIRNCPGANRDHQERNIYPTICGFDSDHLPIVCCGYLRRYEAACRYKYGDPDTDKVCPRRGFKYSCDNEDGSSYSFSFPSGGVRAGPVSHMAALGWKFGEETTYKCGGTLISNKFVLTAAHCTSYNGQQPNIVRTGAAHLLKEDPTHTFEIFEIFTHPEYKAPAYYHDIALIRFDYEADRFYKLQLPSPNFACLPPEHLMYDEDIIYDPSRWGEVEALGYGSTSYGDPTDDTHLIKQNIDYLPDNLCIELYPPDENQPTGHQNSTQICAGDLNEGIRDTCQGDSGGSLQRIFKKTLVSVKIPYVFGVTSFGRSCAIEGLGVYNRVTSNLDWIESIVWPTEVFDGINLTQIFGCDEEEKLCLKKIRTFYRNDDPYFPEHFNEADDDEIENRDDDGVAEKDDDGVAEEDDDGNESGDEDQNEYEEIMK